MACCDSSTSLDSPKEWASTQQRHHQHTLAPSSATLYRDKHGNFQLCEKSTICNIPPLAIGLLDLANSGDFAANVFNAVPVPVYAIVLMAVGATVALVMSFVALRDATRSWRNIQKLRQERRLLKELGGDNTVELDINARDLGTEVFDRAGVEVAMGVGAFLIAVGTYMAIGGANRAVWKASNLLSGYVGNALPALYGLLNVGWSILVWSRARRQAFACQRHLEDGTVKTALLGRIRIIQEHATLTAIVCLVSGAFSMVTPTHWWPYPVLLPCGLAFFYASWVYKSRIGYERQLLTGHIPLDKNLLLQDIGFLQSARTILSKNDEVPIQLGLEDMPLCNLLRFMIKCDTFELFCLRLIKESDAVHQFLGNPAAPIKLDEQDVIASQESKQKEEIRKIALSCIEKSAFHRICIHERYLLEVLGSYLAYQHKYGEDQ